MSLQVGEAIVVEQFCHVVGAKTQAWIRCHNPNTQEEAVKLAEDFEDSLVPAKTSLLTVPVQRSSRAPPPLSTPPAPGPGPRPSRPPTPMGNLTSSSWKPRLAPSWDATNRDTRPVHAPRRLTLGASTPRRSVHAPRRSTLGARTSTLDTSALRRSVHVPRRSTLRRIDASTLGAHASTLGARHLAHRRLDARCTHLNARRSVHAPRRFGASTLDALRVDASTLGARTPTLDAWCTHLDFGASTPGARTSMLDASTLGALTLRHSVHAPQRSVHTPRRLCVRRSVHAPRRSTRTHLRCSTLCTQRSVLDARTSVLDASAFDARTSVPDASAFDARTSVLLASLLIVSA
ncbi:UNVERIFIED_CONTAM: hypothetical protein FKN15_011469 [Acipenser sinensis]